MPGNLKGAVAALRAELHDASEIEAPALAILGTLDPGDNDVLRAKLARRLAAAGVDIGTHLDVLTASRDIGTAMEAVQLTVALGRPL